MTYRTMLLAVLVVTFGGSSSQAESNDVDTALLDDPAETVPYYEDFVEGVQRDDPKAERVEFFSEEEARIYYTNVALPQPCDRVIDGCEEEREEPYGNSTGGFETDGSGGGPHYYNNYPHTCDYNLANWIRVKAGSGVNDGSTGDIYLCIGQHYEIYIYPAPDFARPETSYYGSSAQTQDAACINLGQAPSLPNADVTYNFCSYSNWNDFFSWLEPDDWDDLRLWTSSTDGLRIVELEIMHNNQRINLDTGMNAILDRYYARQIFLGWRISQYKHDLMQAIVGEEYMYPILEIAAEDLGFSGSRKYNGDDGAWCSEFAMYAIQNGSLLTSDCPNPPQPLVTGDIGAGNIQTWLAGCTYGSRVISGATIRANPGLMKPGYYISYNNLGHSMIFVGWNGAVGTNMWVIDGNGSNCANAVCLHSRPWANVQNGDFAGNTN